MLGVGSAAPLLLTGCSDTSKDNYPLYYTDVDSCIKEGVVTEAICRLEYNKAWQNHLMSSPRYKSLSNCQFDFRSAGCQKLASGKYIPTMEGYLIYKEQQGNYSSSSGHSGRNSLNIVPIYIDGSNKGNNYYPESSRQNETYSDPGRQYKKESYQQPSTTHAKPSIKTTTKQRGGFGSRAAARGSWGG